MKADLSGKTGPNSHGDFLDTPTRSFYSSERSQQLWWNTSQATRSAQLWVGCKTCSSMQTKCVLLLKCKFSPNSELLQVYEELSVSSLEPGLQGCRRSLPNVYGGVRFGTCWLSFWGQAKLEPRKSSHVAKTGVCLVDCCNCSSLPQQVSNLGSEAKEI